MAAYGHEANTLTFPLRLPFSFLSTNQCIVYSSPHILFDVIMFVVVFNSPPCCQMPPLPYISDDGIPIGTEGEQELGCQVTFIQWHATMDPRATSSP